MAAEPICIYSYKIDPAGVFDVLKRLCPNMQVTGTRDDWTSIVIEQSRGMFRKPARVTVSHRREYYSGSEFATQMRGMQGYFAQFPQNEMTPRIMLLIASFRFSLVLQPQPDPDLYLDSNDERLAYVYAVVKHLDGAIFTPSGLRDAAGRPLYPVGRDPDPKAVMPGIYKPAPQPSELFRYQGGTAPNPAGPTAERVARRALCLGMVAWRGMLERESMPKDRLERAQLEGLKWVEDVGVGPELEPDEWQLLHGAGNADDFSTAEWGIEGAAVLAWALRRYDLPPFDTQTDVAALAEILGLDDVGKAGAFLTSPALRPAEEIETLSRQLIGIHWRLRQQQHHPGPQEFEKKSQDAWFGKLPLGGIRFINSDLAVGQHAINDAPRDVLLPCILTVQERHRAVNWLCGDDETYSRTDTPT